jgi:hypothetical protein
MRSLTVHPHQPGQAAFRAIRCLSLSDEANSRLRSGRAKYLGSNTLDGVAVCVRCVSTPYKLRE